MFQNSVWYHLLKGSLSSYPRLEVFFRFPNCQRSSSFPLLVLWVIDPIIFTTYWLSCPFLQPLSGIQWPQTGAMTSSGPQNGKGNDTLLLCSNFMRLHVELSWGQHNPEKASPAVSRNISSNKQRCSWLMKDFCIRITKSHWGLVSVLSKHRLL